MPTSDAFSRKRKDAVPPVYSIVGDGGLRIPFSSSLYDAQTAEAMALARARNLHSRLYRKDPDGKIFLIESDGKATRVNPRFPEEKTAMSPDMLGNDPYIPGIQINSR